MLRFRDNTCQEDVSYLYFICSPCLDLSVWFKANLPFVLWALQHKLPPKNLAWYIIFLMVVNEKKIKI